MKLTPWPSDLLTPWDRLTPEAKKLFIRQVEVFAAYVAYSDYEIGRVIQAFEDLGKLDNTLIIYQNGDNGTSAEGGPEGTYSEVAFFNGYRPPVDVQTKFYDGWGTEYTYPHMSAGWSWAFDTPFDWFKQNANRFGGTNQNMVISRRLRHHQIAPHLAGKNSGRGSGDFSRARQQGEARLPPSPSY